MLVTYKTEIAYVALIWRYSVKNREQNLGLAQDVLTLEEVSSFLRIPTEKIIPEISSGKLQALRIADEIRILKDDLLRYLELAKSVEAHVSTPKQTVVSQSPNGTVPAVNLTPAPPFEHTWPNRRVEQYKEAYAGNVEFDGSLRSVAIGFTERQSAGRARKRSVIFVDRRPLVEFVGADDFDKSGKMLSLVKRKNGKRLRPGETIPPEYRHLRIEPYRKYVTGAYASSNQAIVCFKDELGVMAEHALLRLRQLETR